jgi:hypothetical protein
MPNISQTLTNYKNEIKYGLLIGSDRKFVIAMLKHYKLIG